MSEILQNFAAKFVLTTSTIYRQPINKIPPALCSHVIVDVQFSAVFTHPVARVAKIRQFLDGIWTVVQRCFLSVLHCLSSAMHLFSSLFLPAERPVLKLLFLAFFWFHRPVGATL